MEKLLAPVKPQDEGGCSWQFGGPNILGTENNFGGTATSEYGGPLFVSFIDLADTGHPAGTTITELVDFRGIIPHNPCSRDRNDDEHSRDDD